MAARDAGSSCTLSRYAPFQPVYPRPIPRNAIRNSMLPDFLLERLFAPEVLAMAGR